MQHFDFFGFVSAFAFAFLPLLPARLCHTHNHTVSLLSSLIRVLGNFGSGVCRQQQPDTHMSPQFSAQNFCTQCCTVSRALF